MLKRFKFILLFASLSISLCLMSNTYSRYVANTTGNVDVLFAKWQILVNSTDITNNSNSAITFAPIIEPNANVKANTMAPSSKGYFDISIDPRNVEVSFKYDINLVIANQNMLDLMITKYVVIPNGYDGTTPLEENDIENNIITDTKYFDNATPNFQYEPFTVRVYFEWFEGKGETMDDTADNAHFTVDANISFEQVISAPVDENIPNEGTEESPAEEELLEI